MLKTLTLIATEPRLSRFTSHLPLGFHAMFNRLARPVMIAAAAAVAITAIPAAASAQAYSYQGGYQNGYQGGGYVPGYGGQTYNYSDYCDRNRQGRSGAGAVIGAGAGAVIGSQLAARGRRTEGSILGGVLGAVVGSAAGRGSGDQCYGYSSGSNYTYSPNTPAYSSGYGYSSDYYSQPAPSYGYSNGGSGYYYDENGYGPYSSAPQYDDRRSDRHDDRYSSGYGDRDGCRLAESRIRLPDGRTETRYVRTCPDQSGRYRVVD
jgi:hypothetical protein